MRRFLCAALLVASTVGLAVIPAGADESGAPKVALSYDYSDNDAHASASNGSFNIIVNVLPEHLTGLIRIIAVPPDNSGDSNLVCSFQWIAQGQVECSFNFTTDGVWAIHAQYQVVPKTDVVASSVTNLRVDN